MTLKELLAKIDTEALESLLTEEPVYESRMMKAAFPDVSIISIPAVELYRLHFALMHFLYNLQNEYADKGKYLHVHFMRTAVFNYPDSDRCAYFDDSTMSFCGHAVEEGHHCRVHNEQLGDDMLESLSLKYFYLDVQNYDKLNSVTAESLLSGAWEVLSGEFGIDEAYAALGLHGHENTATIKMRFRDLCKKHHPDQGGERDRFMTINRSYRMLMKWKETSEPIS